MSTAKKRALLDREAERRLADVGRRLDGATTRASVVIGSALVLAALPVGHGLWRWVSLGFFAVACALAALSLVYRDGPEVPVAGLLERLDEHSVDTLAAEIFEKKLQLLTAEETVMDRRATQLTFSYWTLALGAASLVTFHLIGLT